MKSTYLQGLNGSGVCLPKRRFKTLVCDPPWPGPSEHRSNKAGARTIIPYQTMTGIQLSALNISAIAEDVSQLWLWSPSRQIGDAFLLMQLWAFSYAGLFIWHKPSPTLGPYIRHDCEFILRGVRKGCAIKLPAPVQSYKWPRPRHHSEKPQEAYDLIAQFSDGPRLDMFARQARPGFEAWGNQPGIL